MSNAAAVDLGFETAALILRSVGGRDLGVAAVGLVGQILWQNEVDFDEEGPGGLNYRFYGSRKFKRKPVRRHNVLNRVFATDSGICDMISRRRKNQRLFCEMRVIRERTRRRTSRWRADSEESAEFRAWISKPVSLFISREPLCVSATHEKVFGRAVSNR